MPVKRPASLLVFEGPDDVGKSTLAHDLVTQLNAQGIPSVYLAFPGSEEASLGHHVYELHHEPARFGVDWMNPTSLQVLHVAAHIDTIDRYVLPALSRGITVVLDRFWWSTYVYGRVYGANSKAIDAALQAEYLYWGNVRPQAVFLVNRSTRIMVGQSEGTPVALSTALTCAYNDLAAVEASKYPVVKINNDGRVEDALAYMLNYLDLGGERSEG